MGAEGQHGIAARCKGSRRKQMQCSWERDKREELLMLGGQSPQKYCGLDAPGMWSAFASALPVTSDASSVDRPRLGISVYTPHFQGPDVSLKVFHNFRAMHPVASDDWCSFALYLHFRWPECPSHFGPLWFCQQTSSLQIAKSFVHSIGKSSGKIFMLCQEVERW